MVHDLPNRPEAQTPNVEQILAWVQKGRIRLPHFQRPLRWRSSHVIALFDSIYRGFPISDLLFQKKEAEAEELHFGGYHLSAPKRADALYVIDGQQRVTSLVAALLHPQETPRGDIYAIWFDLEECIFARLSSGSVPETWIPLNVVCDSARLLRWLRSWPLATTRPDLEATAIDLGKRLREYQVSVYIVEEAREETLRRIFKRKNTAGVSMKEWEIFDALHGRGKGAPLADLGVRLAGLGYGTIARHSLHRCIQRISGKNQGPRHTSLEEESPFLEEEIRKTEEALSAVLNFLAVDAGIPHVSLLPYQLPLEILSYFFHYHSKPSARSRLLLTRWLFRGALSKEHAVNSNERVATLLQAIDKEDESKSIQGLLLCVPKSFSIEPKEILGTIWNARHAWTRLCALVLLSLAPRDPETYKELELDALDGEKANFQEPLDAFFDPDPSWKKKTSQRRILLPGKGKEGKRRALQKLLRLTEPDMLTNPLAALTLKSHALTIPAVKALQKGDSATFEMERHRVLTQVAGEFFAERAGLADSDRPPIRDIVRDIARDIVQPVPHSTGGPTS